MTHSTLLDTEHQNIRIAVDAMGGDFAPTNVVAGALEALRDADNRFEVVFVGPEEILRRELPSTPSGDSYRIVHASQSIDMHDGATAALKQKKDSSIAVGISLHHEGKADAFVSAGNTGAVMSASTLILGRIEGVSRPTIGAFFPTEEGACLIVDAGANVDCRPRQLFEFAMMGSIYMQEMSGIERPTVGLLNIGEEDSKGNEAAKEAYALLQTSRLNFVGNIEGRDILQGKAQVVVCDGFVGNILLKFGESVPAFLKSRLKEHAGGGMLTKLAALMMRKTLRSALKSLDCHLHCREARYLQYMLHFFQ